MPGGPKAPEMTQVAPKLPAMPPQGPPATEPKNKSWLSNWNSPPSGPEPYNAFTPAPAPRTGAQANAAPLYGNAFGVTQPQMPPQANPQGYPMGPTGPMGPMMMAGGMPMMPPPGMIPYGATPYPVPYYRPMPSADRLRGGSAEPGDGSPEQPANGLRGGGNSYVSRPGLDVPAQLRTLLESAHPSEREAAVQNLGDADWHVHTRVVPALTDAAVKDPAPLVRAACVATLVRIHAPVEALQPTLDVLQNDRDIRVRHEVDVARDVLSHQQ